MLLLGRKTAAQRVATFLLEMDKRLAVTGQIALPMSRCDIADYLGLTLETVSRTVSQFHDEGVLTLAGARHIRLRDRTRLAAMDA
jgi:CRP/FNR family nitrogen fixation transcriptional regulator